MELIVISSPDKVTHEASIVNNLFDAGLARFHLRKPHSGEADLRRLLDDINPQHYDKIAIHQHHLISADYGINRLHYPEYIRNLIPKEQFKSKNRDRVITSTSIHDLKSTSELLAFDYLFYGPVFNSLSKPGYQSTVPADLKLDKYHSKPLLVALGGIEPGSLSVVAEMGFDGAAVLGAIWNDPYQAIPNFTKLQQGLYACN